MSLQTRPSLLAALAVLLCICPAIAQVGGGFDHRFNLPGQVGRGAGYGYSLASAGDFDGDSHPDLMVSNPLSFSYSTIRGVVKIYSGTSGRLIHLLVGPPDCMSFGGSIAPAGDVNNDGIDDVIVGAPHSNRSHAYVYSGGNSAGPALAFDRGEVATVAAPWGTLRTRRPHMLKEVQLVQVALGKDKLRPDVPLLMDLVTDPKQKIAVKFLSAQASFGRTLAAPPGVPADRVAALRKAFDATMNDPKFRAAAKKRKMDLAPLSGAELQKMVLEHLATPADIVKVAKKAAGMK